MTLCILLTVIDETFETDQEDTENEDAAKAEEQKRQLDDWIRYCEQDELIGIPGCRGATSED